MAFTIEETVMSESGSSTRREWPGTEEERPGSAGEPTDEPTDDDRQGPRDNGRGSARTTAAALATGTAIGAAAALVDGSSRHRPTPTGAGAAVNTPGPGEEPASVETRSAAKTTAPVREPTSGGTGADPARSGGRTPRDGGPPAGSPPAAGSSSGGGRNLGLTAAAGLGTAAAADLLGSGDRENDTHATPPGGKHAVGHAVPGQMFVTQPVGDQGFTPTTNSPPEPTALGGPAATSSGTPVQNRSSQSPTSQDPTGPSPPAAGITPSQSGQTPWTIGPQNSGQMPSQTSGVPESINGSGMVHPASSASPLLYDSQGHPLGTVDSSGRLVPAPGSAWSGDPHGLTSVLYDSSGRPVAMVGSSGDIVPISASQTPATLGTVSRQSANSAPNRQQPPPNGTDSSQGSTQTQQPTSSELVPGPSVPYTDEEINNIMLGETPEQRRQEVDDALRRALDDPAMTAEQRAAIQSVLNSGNIPNLSDDFFSHNYSYTPKDENGNTLKDKSGNPVPPENLNALSAVATVALLTDQYNHLKVDISTLSDASDQLELKMPHITTPANKLNQSFEDALGKFDWVIDKWGDPDGSIAKAKAGFIRLKAVLFGGEYLDFNCIARVDGNVAATAKTIENYSSSLGEAASKYIQMEDANLSQFGLSVDGFDPRSKRDKDRYIDGKDNSDKHPPGYYDTTNPASPYYKQK